MANFVAVPAQDIERFLSGLQFERSVYGQEVVYVRKSRRNPDVQLKVYTSIRVGQTAVRAAGKDAIRVCVVFDNGQRSFGIGKFSPIMRVHSVKSVLDRLFERLQEASRRANEWMTQEESRHGVHPAGQAWKERLEEKAAFAAYERAQEEGAFMNDPDMRAMEAEEPGDEYEPCSEPPESGDIRTYSQYVAAITGT